MFLSNRPVRKGTEIVANLTLRFQVVVTDGWHMVYMMFADVNMLLTILVMTMIHVVSLRDTVLLTLAFDQKSHKNCQI